MKNDAIDIDNDTWYYEEKYGIYIVHWITERDGNRRDLYTCFTCGFLLVFPEIREIMKTYFNVIGMNHIAFTTEPPILYENINMAQITNFIWNAYHASSSSTPGNGGSSHFQPQSKHSHCVRVI